MANGIKEFIDTKNPVTVGIIAVLVIAVVAAIFGVGISGYASYSVVDFNTYTPIQYEPATPILPIAISSFEHDGWGNCDETTMGIAKVDSICKQLINPVTNQFYTGAADKQPCLHDLDAPTRYVWAGEIPFENNAYRYDKLEVGPALVGVRCVG